MLYLAITSTNLLNALIWLVIGGVIFGLCHWLIGYVGVPEPFNKVAKVIIAVIAVVICINALLTIVGRPFISW